MFVTKVTLNLVVDNNHIANAKCVAKSTKFVMLYLGKSPYFSHNVKLSSIYKTSGVSFACEYSSQNSFVSFLIRIQNTYYTTPLDQLLVSILKDSLFTPNQHAAYPGKCLDTFRLGWRVAVASWPRGTKGRMPP